MTLFDDVGAFHAHFGLPHYSDGRGAPALMDHETLAFREKFMAEELQEFRVACEENDLARAADALVDLCYVALGTAHMMRVPFDACWVEVQRANMTKVRSTGDDDPRSTRNSRLDVVKPPGFIPPDIAGVIREATVRSSR